MSEEIELINEEEQKIELETSCKDCIFATWKDNFQEGCRLNRIEMLCNKGATLVREEKEDKNYVVLKDRICMACRNSEWAKKNDTANVEAVVRAQMTVRCDVLITMDNDFDIEAFKKTVSSIEKQELMPMSVTGVLNKDGLKPSNLINILKGKGFAWRVEYLVQKVSREEACNTALRRCSAPFYVVFEPGFFAPSSFLADIDKAINDRGERFSLLKPYNSDWNCMVVQRKTHNIVEKYDSEEYKDIVGKISYLASLENNIHMIKDVKDICKLE